MTARTQPIELSLATAGDREQIYRIRHQVYASELHQHPENAERRLVDRLDAINTYVVARCAEAVVGFVAITPPTPQGYSIDKYFRREDLPLVFDGRVYEVRLLTVTRGFRRGPLAGLLMYAALRFAESRGAHTIVAIGRIELLDLYTRVGLTPLGQRTTSGAVTYELMTADLPTLHQHLEPFQSLVGRLERQITWRVDGVSDRPGPSCYHGGAFFSAIGETFDTLERKDTVINADVLDAWFDPAPAVLNRLREHLTFAVKTSPPTHAEGLQRTIGAARGVPEASVLPGAGSSDLIFAAFQRWMTPASRVLILDPMYGEYRHVLNSVIGANVDRFRLSRNRSYDIDGPSLMARLDARYDWVVLVNPNSPTGRHLPRRTLESIIAGAPETTRFWIDETYVDYVEPEQSLERFAASATNVIVCKSMSKVYALSGVRAAYLCGAPALVDDLRSVCPPWSVSLPGQIAACEALKATDYYRAAWCETHVLRAALQHDLESLGWNVIPGCANFLLCQLPPDGPDAADVVQRARRFGLFVRNVANMGSTLGRGALRVAVKDGQTNRKIVEILRDVLIEAGAPYVASSARAMAAAVR
jgi:histidinol-phosphate/aromatic aminotransferase/cobyric acid decarboxylase-like protein/N-acyl-L-homoserine lactone synthetase